ncbi:MAG: nucleotidyl transferase AbiEii/AbiGii toxin family protein [Actinomycetia bacterium]|nr:nucleotidyl transferase AbiEii/AbiGii toxin family protein [Actinomycetes bacterium]
MTDNRVRLLRDRPDELEVYVTRIAELTGIPAAHLEKDFWVTEVLRGAASASASTSCSVIFKGGTSLSKAHRLIERFSEDVDLIVILPQGGAGAGDTKLKAFVKAAEVATGVASSTNSATVTKGVKRTATFNYPTTHVVGALKPGVLMELGTRGGALPHRRLPIQSLLAEHAESIDLPVDFAEAIPLSILVLDPVRTLAEKLVLLHHAATEGDEHRRSATARHYYDIDQLLRNDRVLADLKQVGIDILARETTQHSRAAGLPTAERPADGFSASPAWNTPDQVTTKAYDSVLNELIWPTAHASPIHQCCQRVHELADLL